MEMVLASNKILIAVLTVVVLSSQPLAITVAACEHDQQNQYSEMELDASLLDHFCCSMNVTLDTLDKLTEQVNTDCSDQDCAVSSHCLSLLVPISPDPVAVAFDSLQKIESHTQLATSRLPSSLYRPPISR